MSVKPLLFFCTLLFLSACGPRSTEPAAEPAAARPVRLHTVRAGDDTERMTFPAVLRARESVELAFDVPGVLNELNVTEGRAVEQGTLLAGQIHALDGLGVHGKPQQSIFAPLTFKPKICFTAQLRLSLLISG